MGLTNVEGQAVKLYTVYETLFNDKTSKCEWHLDYENKIGCDDISEIIVNTEVVATDLQDDGTFSDSVSGSNDAVSPFKLADSSADFDNTIVVGMFVRNRTNNTSAIVTVVDSAILITLDTDIFTGAASYDINYYELSPSMSITGGLLVNNAGNAGSAKQFTLPAQDLLYKVEIDVFSFVSGTNGQKIRFKIGGLVVLELDETVVNTGRFTMLGFNTDSPFDEFEIEVDDDIDCSFDNLVISQYSNSIFYIVDASNDQAVYFSSIDEVLVSATQDQMKISVDWSNADCNSCYYIAITEDVDLSENIGGDKITNGDFKNDTEWTKGSGWSISVGQAIIALPSGSGDLSQSLSRANTFSSGICYDITFTILNYGIGDCTIELGSTSSPLVKISSPAYTSAGTHTWNTGILGTSFDIFSVLAGVDLQSWSIDNISAIIDIECTGYKFRTDNFYVSDSFDCNVKLSGFNNDNAFGIDFIGLNYNPIIRVPGELTTPFFDGEKVNEEDSLGNSESLYFKSNQLSNLFLYQLPNHLHNFIRLLIGYDSFLIDDVGYIAQDADYSPESERVLGKLPDTSNAIKEVRLKEDLNKNRFC